MFPYNYYELNRLMEDEQYFNVYSLRPMNFRNTYPSEFNQMKKTVKLMNRYSFSYEDEISTDNK